MGTLFIDVLFQRRQVELPGHRKLCSAKDPNSGKGIQEITAKWSKSGITYIKNKVQHFKEKNKKFF